MGEKALLIRLGAIGDTIQASSIAGLIKMRNPDMQIDFLASAGLEPLFSMIPEVDRVHGLHFRRIPFGINPGWIRLRRRLNSEPFSLVFLMETDARFRPLLEQVHAHRKIALGDEERDGAEGPDVPNPVRHQRVLWNKGLVPGEIIHPKLSLGDDQEKRAGEVLTHLGIDPMKPMVGLHPGNSFRKRKKMRRWIRSSDLRSWPEDRWCELICGMHRMNNHVQAVLFGSRQDRVTNERIKRRVREFAPGIRLADTAGKTDLPLSAAVLKRFCLFISTDTGPIHMAAALGVPLIGLYGPTRFEETRPFPSGPEAVVVRKTLSCQPCYGTPRQKQCKDNLCMRSIEVKDVLSELVNIRQDIFSRELS